MNSMKFVIPLLLISWIKIPNDAVAPQRQSQFTPKMKANAVPRLLSSLVWIDQYNEMQRNDKFHGIHDWPDCMVIWYIALIANLPFSWFICIWCSKSRRLVSKHEVVILFRTPKEYQWSSNKNKTYWAMCLCHTRLTMSLRYLHAFTHLLGLCGIT